MTIRRPGAILALLTGLNFLNYLDRMIVAAVLVRLQEPGPAGLGLSNTEGGLLATVFLLGYFLTAPVFGALADRGPRKGLIALGVLTWSLATAASGLAGGFATMLLARAVVGVGEASYATLAPTIIDDLTPPERKGKALAVFYAAMPIGAAAGFMLGGYVATHWGWRAAFFVAGGPGAVLALSCLLIQEPARRLHDKADILGAARRLARIPIYRRAVLGYCAHTAVVGAFAHWGPKFLVARYDLALPTATFWFGLVTVVAGFLGTVVGGRWLDRVLARARLPDDVAHDAVDNRRALNHMLRISAIGVAVATPAAFAAFLVPTAGPFFALAFVVEVGLFLGTSPLNAALLRGVPTELRASSMAAAIFAIHLFGDLWSPSLVGVFADYAPMVLAMMALPVALAVATAIWWPRAREAAP